MARSQYGMWIVLGILGTALPSLALQYELSSCETADFGQKYQSLVANEPAVAAAFDKMVQYTGNTGMNKCTFMTPVENGTPVKGAMRRFVLDKTWHTIQTVAGLEKEVFHRHGLSVEYLLNERPLPNGGVAISREVISLQVCRTPVSCQRLGIDP